MATAVIEVSADILVSVRFQMDIDSTATLEDTNKQARAAAERVAQAAIGPGTRANASAIVQQIKFFTAKLT